MSLPALADLEALAARIFPSGIDEAEEPRAQAALDDASALIRAEAGQDWVTAGDPVALSDDLPDVAVTVCLAAARRALVNPDGVVSETIQGYATNYGNDSGDVYLTRAERRLIRRASGLGTVGVQRTTRTEYDYGALDTRGVVVGEVAPFAEFPYDY